MESLNLIAEDFCHALGLPRRSDLMTQLRDLQLVRFFKVGKKYFYPREDVYKIQELLLSGQIQIRTDNGEYYITLGRSVAPNFEHYQTFKLKKWKHLL